MGRSRHATARPLLYLLSAVTVLLAATSAALAQTGYTGIPTLPSPPTVGPTNLGPTNLGPTNLGPTNLGPTNLGPTYVGPPYVGPPYVDPPYVDPAYVDSYTGLAGAPGVVVRTPEQALAPPLPGRSAGRVELGGERAEEPSPGSERAGGGGRLVTGWDLVILVALALTAVVAFGISAGRFGSR